MGIYMLFAGILFLAYAFCASLLLIIGLIVESRGLKIVGAIAQHHSNDPSWVFEQEFGTPPPREVTALRGHATGMNNTGWVYLSFSAPPEVIDALVSNLMVPTSPKELPLLRRPPTSRDRPPIWWNPPAVPPAKMYMARQVRQLCDACGIIEILYYDPATHVAYFGRL